MNKISHTGIVETIKGTLVSVRIVQTAACAACKAARHCSASESKEKVIEVDDASAAQAHRVGDQVVVTMSAANGRDAVLLAFVIPFVIMTAVLAVTLWLSHNEPLAALAGVGSLLPYYLAVYLCKDRIAGKFAFVIEN